MRADYKEELRRHEDKRIEALEPQQRVLSPPRILLPVHPSPRTSLPVLTARTLYKSQPCTLRPYPPPVPSTGTLHPVPSTRARMNDKRKARFVPQGLSVKLPHLKKHVRARAFSGGGWFP